MGIDKKWLYLRERVIDAYGNICMCCGKVVYGNKLHVDHIYPKSLYPHLKYNLSNLQVLCDKCNIKKSNIKTTDYRTESQKRIFGEVLVELNRKSLNKNNKANKKEAPLLSKEEKKEKVILKKKVRSDFVKILRALSDSSCEIKTFIYDFINKYGIEELHNKMSILPDRIKKIIIYCIQMPNSEK